MPRATEPSIQELFLSYLAEQGTRGAAADRVMETFGKLIEAIETEQEAVFPEEAAISIPSQAQALSDAEMEVT